MTGMSNPPNLVSPWRWVSTFHDLIRVLRPEDLREHLRDVVQGAGKKQTVDKGRLIVTSSTTEMKTSCNNNENVKLKTTDIILNYKHMWLCKLSIRSRYLYSKRWVFLGHLVYYWLEKDDWKFISLGNYMTSKTGTGSRVKTKECSTNRRPVSIIGLSALQTRKVLMGTNWRPFQRE